MCVCVYFLPPQRLLLTEIYDARDQVSDGMLRKLLCVKFFRRHFIDNHSRDFRASNCSRECQLNRAKPREVKDNSQNFLKTKGKSAKHSYLPPH